MNEFKDQLPQEEVTYFVYWVACIIYWHEYFLHIPCALND
jgi:hypothetical protein